ncbi:MAG: PmoA family protein, partial [Pirellulales bacterium]|nr:PmoA family protein [Pirellulales bacterium]
MRISALFAVCLSVCTFATPPQATAAEGFAWKDAEGKHTDLLYNGDPVLRYMYEAIDESSPERREETMKPYHHVFSPDGTLLTKGPGGLFPHHRGLFYGFSKIKYGDGEEADTWHNHHGEWQSHEQELDRQADGNAASHRVAIDWHGRDGAVFAHEERELAVKGGKNGDVDGWLIDFTSQITPAEGLDVVHFDGDPQHAGFQFRASQEVPDKTAKQTYYLRPDGKGKEGETRNWDHAKPDAPGNKQSEDLPWNAVSIVLGGKRYTVLYLDHRGNPKPARYSERDYARFGSYFVA